MLVSLFLHTLVIQLPNCYLYYVNASRSIPCIYKKKFLKVTFQLHM